MTNEAATSLPKDKADLLARHASSVNGLR